MSVAALLSVSYFDVRYRGALLTVKLASFLVAPGVQLASGTFFFLIGVCRYDGTEVCRDDSLIPQSSDVHSTLVAVAVFLPGGWQSSLSFAGLRG